MSERDNARLARVAWDAIARGDAEGLTTLLAEDLVWHATARGAPWAGEHRGAERILDFLARVGEATDVFDAQLVDVLASESRVMVLFRVRLAVGNRRADSDYMLLARVADMRFAEIWTAPLDPDAIEQFWAWPRA